MDGSGESSYLPAASLLRAPDSLSESRNHNVAVSGSTMQYDNHDAPEGLPTLKA